jgi:hypothetical protein
MIQAIKPEKDTYTFQKARIERLAAELGKHVEFDSYVTANLSNMSVIKFRVADVDRPFTATPTSGDLRLSELADKPNSWLKNLILKLARE